MERQQAEIPEHLCLFISIAVSQHRICAEANLGLPGAAGLLQPHLHNNLPAARG